MSDKKDIEKIELKSNDVLLVRLDDRYNAEEVNQIVQEVSQIVNENADQEGGHMNPVLFMDKSVELETLPIGTLEDILKQAKSISENHELDQDEIEVEEEKPETLNEEEIENMHEKLKELVPKDVKDNK